MRNFRAWAICVFTPCILAGGLKAQTSRDFFNDTVVQEVRLTVAPDDWSSLKANYLDDTYYHAQFNWQGTSLSIGIRSHGGGSRSPIKPNLNLKFDKYTKHQVFAGQSLVVAKANNEDASNLHEIMVFKLFRRMGLPAPREVPGRLYVNDELIGFYMLVEHEDEQFLDRNFGEDAGYLYEWDPAFNYNFENLGTDPASYAPLLELKTSQDAPDLNNFVNLIQAINTSADADFIPALSKYLDPKLYLTHAALENFVAEGDGMVGGIFGVNNIDLYQFSGQSLYQLIVWDKDLTFTSGEWDVNRGLQQNALTRRLMAIPEYSNVYYSALTNAAKLFEGPGGWADQETSRLYDLIAPDARNDPNKQCFAAGTLFACGTSDFENAVVMMREFISARANYVLGAVGQVHPDASAPVLSTVTVLHGSGDPTPGSVITIAGTQLGNNSIPAGYPRTVGGEFIAIDGVRAALVAATDGQIQVQVPWDLPASDLRIVASVNGALSNAMAVSLEDFSPAVLALTHADGSSVDASNPARRGETVVAYAIGLGPIPVELAAGTTSSSKNPVRTLLTPQVLVDAFGANVSFAGLTPGFLGLYQVNFTIPSEAPAGDSVSLIFQTTEYSMNSSVSVQ